MKLLTRLNLSLALATLILSLSSSLLQAEANMCLNHIKRIERQEGIPRNLLLAMARVESGRWDKQSKNYRAWPWTVNVEGKAHYLDTRAKAIDLINKHLKENVTNIDVGCMQLNYAHHHEKFSTIGEMLDPAKNVRYAAKFLKKLKVAEKKPWSEAVGNYHSRTQVHHSRYKARVYKALNKVNQIKEKKVVEKDPITQTVLSQSSGALYSYERKYGWTTAQRKTQVKKSHVKSSAHKRSVLMKSKGVKDLSFMSSKVKDKSKVAKKAVCSTCRKDK